MLRGLYQHYNREPGAPLLALPAPDSANTTGPPASGGFERNLLGGLVHEYHRAAVWTEVLQPLCAGPKCSPSARPAGLNIGATLSRMTSIAGIVALVVVLVPLAIVGAVFVWAARKDGAEDKALQARLGIRRKTRLGR